MEGLRMRRTLWVFIAIMALCSMTVAKEFNPYHSTSNGVSHEVTGRCCYGNGQCSQTARDYCEGQLGGTWSSDHNCSEPCRSVVQNGRCCYTALTGAPACDMVAADSCGRLQGTWTADATCATPCCIFPYTGVDQGTLVGNCYPTLLNNPGHAMTHIAWLGARVDSEAVPNVSGLNRDDVCHSSNRQTGGNEIDDDGFVPSSAHWMPCTEVSALVSITAGPNYQAYVNCGGHLYLNAWKDGNFDGDFNDSTCASEWIIQDVQVQPGRFQEFRFVDPGVFDHGHYPGVIRVRLTSHRIGRFGYGLADPNGACPDSNRGTFAFDSVLGEVEDYWFCDLQLSVNLTSFTATPGSDHVTLNWATASETNNDRFEIERNDQVVARIDSRGNGAGGNSYSWTDNNVETGVTYEYALWSQDINGNREKLRTVQAAPRFDAATSVTEYALYTNYPNPFNPTTSIAFDLPEKNFVTLKVFNMMGQEVAELVNGEMTSGRHIVDFNGRDLPSALYLYKLTAGTFTSTQKMLLIK
jgi:hypothetical protein